MAKKRGSAAAAEKGGEDIFKEEEQRPTEEQGGGEKEAVAAQQGKPSKKHKISPKGKSVGDKAAEKEKVEGAPPKNPERVQLLKQMQTADDMKR
eukprot:jgi/Mesen1/3684/ME000202S02774